MKTTLTPRPLVLLFVLLLPLTATGAPPHVAGGDRPRDGVVTLATTELWRHGGEDDDLIFGSLRTVEIGPDGLVYALDTQLSQVFVFDAQGGLLRTLSREGEGPGEVRRPEDMVFFADGSLGLAQYINGRIVRITRDGTPLDTLMPPGDANGGGALSSIRRVRCRGGSLVINGARVTPTDDGMMRTQYLVRCDEQAQPLVEYLASSTSSNLQRDGWIERNNYFPSHERWDIDEQGRVLAAAERNAYVINVYEPDGAVALTFGREAEAWRRTEDEKQEIRDSLVVLRDGERVRVEVDVEDREPAVLEVHAMPGGETWVLPSGGRRGQPEGVMQTYDVFDDRGVWVRQVAVRCPGDPDEDRLFLLGDGRLALVTGAVQARRNTFGGSRTEEADVASHELVVLAEPTAD